MPIYLDIRNTEPHSYFVRTSAVSLPDLLTLLFPHPGFTDPIVMGCSVSTPTPLGPAGKDGFKQNAMIERMIRMDKKKYDRTVKILLLGMSCIHFPALLQAQRVGMLKF